MMLYRPGFKLLKVRKPSLLALPRGSPFSSTIQSGGSETTVISPNSGAGGDEAGFDVDGFAPGGFDAGVVGDLGFGFGLVVLTGFFVDSPPPPCALTVEHKNKLRATRIKVLFIACLRRYRPRFQGLTAAGTHQRVRSYDFWITDNSCISSKIFQCALGKAKKKAQNGKMVKGY